MSAHRVVPGAEYGRDALGRALLLCAVCGKPSRGRNPEHAVNAGAVAPPVEPSAPAELALPATPPPPAPAPRKVADWRLLMLRHVVELVAESRVELEPLTELRVHELRAAIRSELYGTAQAHANGAPAETHPGAPAPILPPELGRPDPVTLRLGSSKVRGLLHGIRGDRQRELVHRAIACGWRWERGNGGHIRLYPLDGSAPLTVSTTAEPVGHGWRNLRASAARAGLDVAGL